MEETGFHGMRGALLAAGAKLAPVPVDDEELSVMAGQESAPEARLACISSSHQYPLGITVSLPRRLKLLEWGRVADAFTLEDDYDSEHRYRGRPLAALQGLDEEGRVIYIGTMSEVMFPGLRIGYIVVPDDLGDAFRAVRILIDTHPSSIAQAARADFITGGFLSAYIRRMRSLYEEQQQSLIKSVFAHLGGILPIELQGAGMHLLGMLEDCFTGTEFAKRAGDSGVQAAALSAFYDTSPKQNSFLLGYAGVDEKEINGGTKALAAVFAKA